MLGWCRWIGWAPFWRWHWSNGERTQYWIVCNSRTLRVLSFVCAELGVEYCDRFMAQGESLSHDNGAPDAQLGWSVAATRGHSSTKRLPERGKKERKMGGGRGRRKNTKNGRRERDKSSPTLLNPTVRALLLWTLLAPHPSGPCNFFDEILLDESVIE